MRVYLIDHAGFLVNLCIRTYLEAPQAKSELTLDTVQAREELCFTLSTLLTQTKLCNT